MVIGLTFVVDDDVPSGRHRQRVRRHEPSLLQVEPIHVGAIAAGVPEVGQVPAALGYPQPVMMYRSSLEIDTRLLMTGMSKSWMSWMAEEE